MATFTNKDLLKLITTGSFKDFKYEGDAEQLCDDLWDELERGEGGEEEEEEDFEEDAEEDFDDEDLDDEDLDDPDDEDLDDEEEPE